MTSQSTRLEASLRAIDAWGADHAAAGIVGSAGTLATHGDPGHEFRWASVTKLVTAMVVLIAADRHLLDLDEAAGPPGASIRHLLAHTAGLAFDGPGILAQPGRRRIYSNPAFDLLGDLVAERSGRPFGDLLGEWVLGPLGMSGTTLVERPSEGLHGPLTDLAAFARELQGPTLIDAGALAAATSVAFPGLSGVVPGVGRFEHCDWGLGFELHDGKSPHWMGRRNSPATFGHFGGAGTFLWIDPDAGIGLVALTDREFGPWALDAWPRLSDAILVADS